MELSHRERHSLRIVGAYCVFLAIMLWWEFRERSSSDESVEPTDRERVLERLEQGETVRIPRWHGHELELSGELVVDAEALPDEETEK